MWKFFSLGRPPFDQIKSGSVWKFNLNQNQHCSILPSPFSHSSSPPVAILSSTFCTCHALSISPDVRRLSSALRHWPLPLALTALSPALASPSRARFSSAPTFPILFPPCRGGLATFLHHSEPECHRRLLPIATSVGCSRAPLHSTILSAPTAGSRACRQISGAILSSSQACLPLLLYITGRPKCLLHRATKPNTTAAHTWTEASSRRGTA
jgi:hypothetical protein